jgi:hypothetical protein
MMSLHRKKIHPAILGSIVTISLATLLTTTGSRASQPSDTPAGSSQPALTAPSTDSRGTLKPGPAWKTIGGTIKNIKGSVYIVEDYEGNQVQLYVSRETKHLRGNKKVGDRVRAEITRGGFANSIQ